MLGLTAYRAHSPVSTSWAESSSASRTTSLGTPNPPGRPVRVEAKTVVRTRPAPSTSGPPELPLWIVPRSEVRRRVSGPLP